MLIKTITNLIFFLIDYILKFVVRACESFHIYRLDFLYFSINHRRIINQILIFILIIIRDIQLSIFSFHNDVDACQSVFL